MSEPFAGGRPERSDHSAAPVRASHRLRLIACAIIVGLGGCAAAPAFTAADTGLERSKAAERVSEPRRDQGPARADGPEPVPAYGSYLAGQHARARGDLKSAVAFFMDAIKADPDNTVLLQQGFSLAIADGRYDAAEELAKKLDDGDNFNSLPRIFLILDKVKARQYDQALADTAAIPDTGLNRLMKPLIRAWALAGAGRQDEAIAALDPLSDVPAFRAFAEHHRAYLLDWFDDPAAAAAYEELLGPDRQQNLRTILAYGRLLLRKGQEDRLREVLSTKASEYLDPAALAVAEKRLRRNKDEPLLNGPVDGVSEAFYGGAAALSLDQANGPAAFYLRFALYLKPNFSEARFLLGRLLEADQQYDAALAAYGEVDPRHEFHSEAQLREVWVLQAMEREEEALERLFAIIDRGTDNVEALSALADLFREKSDFEEAAAYYSRALDMVPHKEERHWVLYYARAIAYDQAKKWPQAEADLQTALELKPEQPDVLNYLGYSWVDRGLNLTEAEEMILRAVEQRPNDGYIVDSLGWAQFKRGRFDEAVETLERAVLLRPEDPTLNEHLGDAYWQVGRQTEARFQWSHALSLGAAEDRAGELRQKIADGLPVSASKAARDESRPANDGERP